MRVAIGNLGALTFALKSSLESLGVEVLISPINNSSTHQLSQKYMPSELCYPLKLLLGNYLYSMNKKPDAVIFYTGCDICNLAPINYSYREIFNEMGCFPDVYFCDINSKKRFLITYLDALKKISNRPWHNIASSLSIGIKKYESLHFLDQVFYSIRPVFSSVNESEYLYNSYFDRIVSLEKTKEIAETTQELMELFNDTSKLIPEDVLRVGLVGDSYSITEPFAHQYVDKQLGHLGVVVDRWSTHRLLPKDFKKLDKNDIRVSSTLSGVIKNNYGVFTPLELVKLSRYVIRGYDGIVFISPLECNPNDALRNLLAHIQNETTMPILSLVFDEHTCSTGVQVRLEAFVDLLNRRKNSKIDLSAKV